MTAFTDFWQGLTRTARFGLLMGVSLIVIATIALGTWALRTDYQVLFADLAPQDAATMVAELEKMKVPYQLSNGGNTILVPTDIVYKTRMKLVGKELPLRGAVGFELFNNSEVGMTEFAQKVNYQRALQGELTRTILSLDEVLSVRVHLVLSEQALFKKSNSQAKASITIATKPGKILDANQIQGIQCLVGAAVPDIKPNDVTIVNQQGVALTRRSNIEGEMPASSDGLEGKRAIEAYLNKKLVEVLDRTFGVGQAIASVDVTLNHENTKVTTENVLGAGANGAGASAGLIVRERHTMRVPNNDAEAANATVAAPGKTGLASSEVDYQVGRRVEQVVSTPGAVNHLNVAVVVKKVLEPAQLDRVKDIVARAIGIVKERGDLVAVYSVDQITSSAHNGAIIPPEPLVSDATDKSTVAAAPAERVSEKGPGFAITLVLVAALVLALMVLVWRTVGARSDDRRPLSAHERDKLLAQVKSWLSTPPGSPAHSGEQN